MTAELERYDARQLDGYQAALVMTPEAARALDEQVRRCTEAVLREGADYGVIPGTGGDKTLWRPGAQKLLQWFGLSYTCDRVEVERDDQGRKHGITYKCTVGRRLPDGSIDVKATCEGTADYDESKFYQSAEEVQFKAEAKERMWAKKDRRVANPEKWKNLGEYRADWNALMKRAQKRAIVGAVVDATAAGGIFSDREEDDHAPAAEDGTTWYGQALEAALTFTRTEDGQQLLVDASHAARDGLCTPGQCDHVKNRTRQRLQLLQTATPVAVEDLTGIQPQSPPQETTDTQDDGDDRHRKLVGAVQGHMKRLGFTVDDSDREERIGILATLAGLGTDGFDSTGDFAEDELSTIAGTLAKCRNRAALSKLLKAGETDG